MTDTLFVFKYLNTYSKCCSDCSEISTYLATNAYLIIAILPLFHSFGIYSFRFVFEAPLSFQYRIQFVLQFSVFSVGIRIYSPKTFYHTHIFIFGFISFNGNHSDSVNRIVSSLTNNSPLYH